MIGQDNDVDGMPAHISKLMLCPKPKTYVLKFNKCGNLSKKHMHIYLDT